MDVDSDSESVVFSAFSEEHPPSVADSDERRGSSVTSLKFDPSMCSYSPMSIIFLRESMQANILYRRARTITPTDIPSQLARNLNGSVRWPVPSLIFWKDIHRYITGRKYAPPMAEVIESELATY